MRDLLSAVSQERASESTQGRRELDRHRTVVDAAGFHGQLNAIESGRQVQQPEQRDFVGHQPSTVSNVQCPTRFATWLSPSNGFFR